VGRVCQLALICRNGNTHRVTAHEYVLMISASLVLLSYVLLSCTVQQSNRYLVLVQYLASFGASLWRLRCS